MKLERKIYIQSLFDLYSPLLTNYQREIFALYYEEDLSLFEIAENKNISRNAVFSLLHRVEKSLENYEKKMKLLEKKEKTLELLRKNCDEKIVAKIEDIYEG